jgi:voltage-gated potassium channel
MSNIISFNSKFKIRWDIGVVVAVLISLIAVPYEVIFVHQVTPFSTVLYFGLSTFFLLDIFLKFRTSIKYFNEEITDRSRIKKQYLKTGFWIDFLGAFPFELLFIGSSLELFNEPVTLILRLNVLLRLRRFFEAFKSWSSFHWVNSGILRLTRFLIIMLILMHLVSCAWFSSSYSNSFPEDSWVALEGLQYAEPETQYIRSLYWTVTTMTTIGYGDITPHTNTEYGFVIVVMLLGATMYAYIIGNIASIISNIDTLKNDHDGRKDSLLTYLRQNHTPDNLMDKVNNYFDYIWRSKKGVNENELFNDLPVQLKLELMHHLSSDLLEKVHLFRNSSKALKEDLLAKLELMSFPPDVILSHRNAFSSGVYFISKGTLHVYGESDQEFKADLAAGDYFGLVPLMLNEPSGGTIKTSDYCEVFYLPYLSFNELKKQNSEFNQVLKESAKNKSEKQIELFMEGIVI